jgi:hypothetical protein
MHGWINNAGVDNWDGASQAEPVGRIQEGGAHASLTAGSVSGRLKSLWVWVGCPPHHMVLEV